MADSQRTVVLTEQLLAEVVRQSLREKGTFELTVTGYSMSPLLQPGRDRVLLAPADKERIREREILLFSREDGSLVLHRLLRRLKNGQLRMNGDGQVWTEDISRDQVIALVQKIRRNGKVIDCASRGYRFAAWLWTGTRPFRKGMLAVKRMVIRGG